MIRTITRNNLILLIIPIIIWIVVYFVIGFDGLYGQDSYEYLRYTKAISHFMKTGEHPGDYFWPLYYPISGAIVNLLTNNEKISLLTVSVLSLSTSAYYLHKLITLLFPENIRFSILYVIGFYIFSPYVVKSSVTVMSDMLATCFIIVTVYNFYKYKFDKIIINFYGIAIFSVFAVMTRYASAILVLPFILISINYFIKQEKFWKHVLPILVVVGILTLPHFLVRYSNYDSFLSHPWLNNWSLANFFNNSFITVDGYSDNLLPNLIYSFSNFFHPAYIFLGPFLIFILIKKRSLIFLDISLVAIILYALFLAGIPFQNNRFLLLSFPIVLVSFYPAFNFISHRLQKKLFLFGISAVVVVQLMLTGRTLQPIFERNRFELNLTEQLKPYQNKTLYSFDVDIALKGRGLNFNYKNLWENRYEDFQQGELVLFHPTKFEKQWNHKNPMINWKKLNSNYSLKTILNGADGWKLYKIERN